MIVMTIARFTIHEAISRRLVLAALILSAAFLGLYLLGYSLVLRQLIDASAGVGSRTVVAGGLVALTLLGLYAVSFLSSFLALFLSVGAISSDVESGTLYAILARPIRRSSYLIGRWLGVSCIALVYSLIMASGVLAIASIVGDYQAIDAPRAVALMLLNVLVLVTMGFFASTWLSTLAGGMVCFSVFGLAWIAGIIELVGGFIDNIAMINLGIAVSLLFPSDALWRGASYYAQSTAAQLLQAGSRSVIPFAAGSPPVTIFVVWAIFEPICLLVAAIYIMRRRDL